MTHNHNTVLWTEDKPVINGGIIQSTVFKKKNLLALVTATICLIGPPAARAETDPQHTTDSRFIFSTNMYGLVGLNTIPTARQDKRGTVRLGISTADLYLYGFLGFQVSDNLYMNFRQTTETSNLNEEPDFYRPTLDVKYNIWDETRLPPALSFGMDAAFGDKRTSSEYIVLSKRLNRFDITGGLGWGRLGGEGHFKNPFHLFSDHFDENRNFNSFSSQNTEDWFIGKEVGLFGGIEYFTTINGLSVKADYNAMDYSAEQFTIPDYDAPVPWSIGLNYKAWEPLDLSLGILGGKKIMARMSLQENVAHWPLTPAKPKISNHPYRLLNNDLLNLHSYYPAPWQIAQAAKTKNARQSKEKISFN